MNEQIDRSQGVSSCSDTEDGFSMSQFVSSGRTYNAPLDDDEMKQLIQKNSAPDTLKKINWVRKMFREWRDHRNSLPSLEWIRCDLDKKSTIDYDSFVFTVTRFLTEVKKLDGTEFPGKTLYDITICLQFHLESTGIGWKLLNKQYFRDIKFTLDNLMKLHTSKGIGNSVKKAQILSGTDEKFLWSMGFLRTQNPGVLLNTIVFLLGN